MNGQPDFTEVLIAAAPLIDARVALTGRPREVYEAYLTRPLRPGQSWEDAIHGRMESLKAGRLPPEAAESLRRQVQAITTQAQVA